MKSLNEIVERHTRESGHNPEDERCDHCSLIVLLRAEREKWEEASKAANHWFEQANKEHNARVKLESAIAAERERCAGIAEDWKTTYRPGADDYRRDELFKLARQRIADAIRRGEAK